MKSLIPLLLIVIAIANSCSNKTPEQSETKQPQVLIAKNAINDTLSVYANKLANDYRLNQINADNIYKGYFYKVYGVVSAIKKTDKDEMYVLLYDDILCLLDNNQKDIASKLLPRQRIVILRGK